MLIAAVCGSCLHVADIDPLVTANCIKCGSDDLDVFEAARNPLDIPPNPTLYPNMKGYPEDMRTQMGNVCLRCNSHMSEPGHGIVHHEGCPYYTQDDARLQGLASLHEGAFIDSTDDELRRLKTTYTPASCPKCGKVEGFYKNADYCSNCGHRGPHYQAARTQGAKSDQCPRCGSHMSDVRVYNNNTVLKAHCDNCGWKGTKKKSSLHIAVPQGRSDYKPGRARVGDHTPQSHPDEFSSEDIAAEMKHLLRLNKQHGTHHLRTLKVLELNKIIEQRKQSSQASIDPRHDMDPLHDIRGTSEIGHCSSCLQSFKLGSTNPTDPVPPCPHCGSTATSVAGATRTHVAGIADSGFTRLSIPTQLRQAGHDVKAGSGSDGRIVYRVNGEEMDLRTAADRYLGGWDNAFGRGPEASLHTAGIPELDEAVDAFARGDGTAIKVGDRIGSYTVMDVGTHTIAFHGDDGYSAFVQIPFVDERGQSLPSHQRAMDELESRGSLHIAKLEQIVAGILETNTGMPKGFAMALAVQTLDRFPHMAAPKPSVPPEEVEDMPHALNRMLHQFQQEHSRTQ